MTRRGRLGDGAPAGGLRRFLDSLFPPSCVICGSSVPPVAPPVCRVCWSRLPRLAPPWCARCGATAPGAELGPDCSECLDWPEEMPPVTASFAMEGHAARLVRALKYAGWTALAPAMGRAMAARVRAFAGEPTPWLVPVPLSAARLRERGFNQATLLARELGRAVEWPVRPLLARSAGAGGQARLGLGDRRRNVQGAFVLAGSGVQARQGGRHGEISRRSAPPLVLVDDVVTTGSTAAACSAVLESAGWHCIGIVAFARTLRDPSVSSVGTGLASHG